MMHVRFGFCLWDILALALLAGAVALYVTQRRRRAREARRSGGGSRRA